MQAAGKGDDIGRGDPPAERLYHLALQADWTSAHARGEPYDRSTLDKSLAEIGFVHCSFADQVQGTADLFYAGRSDVVLLTIDPALLDVPVRVEQRFPHVYGPVTPQAVIAAAPLDQMSDGRLDVARALGTEP